MYLESYKDLKVWQKSIELVTEVYKLTNEFLKEEIYGLTSQMRRAVISVPSNIAEGQRRKDLPEYLQFLRIADASSAELETQIIISKRLYSQLDYLKVDGLLEEVQKMLNVMIYKLSLKAKTYSAKGDISSEARYKLKATRGFTLIETLVVVLVTVILAAIMIVYSHTGEKQIVLFRDQAKVVGILNRAKFLSVQMFSKTIDDKTCAYGVSFENGGKNFSIFKVKALVSNCENSYIAGGNNVVKFEEYSLDSRLKFNTQLIDIVFFPPDPKVILTGTNENTAKITIVDILDTSGKNKREINVNTFGQITAQ